MSSGVFCGEFSFNNRWLWSKACTDAGKVRATDSEVPFYGRADGQLLTAENSSPTAKDAKQAKRVLVLMVAAGNLNRRERR